MNLQLADTAWDLHDKGENTFPLSYRSKKPPKGFEWKSLTQRRVTEDEIREWFCSEIRTNIALLCGQISGIVAVDADTRDNARDLYRVLPKTSAMQKTPNGGHFLYRWPEGADIGPMVKTTIKGIQCDIRGEASYIAIAPSIHPTGKQYEWINWPWNLKDVPEFDPEWVDTCKPPSDHLVNHEERACKPLTHRTGRLERVVEAGDDIVVRIKRARGFMRSIVSVSGSGTGDQQLFRAASALIQKFDIPEAVALEELRAWNQTNAKPPWPDERLRYKIEQAVKNS